MRILIVNDDSISSPALPHLVRWARTRGEVTVVVPKVEQSGMSQSLEFVKPVALSKEFIADDIEVYALASTPADCVRFGVTGLKTTYDLVISGINKGYNLGDDIAYSGTVGAILEGSRLGIKGIALSAGHDRFVSAAEELDRIFDYVLEKDLLSKGDLYNINIPHEIKGFKITKQGGEFYTDEFIDCGDGTVLQTGVPVEREFNDLTVDIDAVRNGYVSITPITACKTDLAVFENIKNI